jgi:unsaturated chondroitin disaccharide hydrolase
MQGRRIGIVAVAAALLSVALTAPASTAAGPSASVVASDLDFARAQLRATAAAVGPTAYPYRTASTGAWETREPSWWTSGFYPGSLWLEYGDTADPWWRAEAERRQAGLESQKSNRSTHDVGFLIMSTYGNAHRLTGLEAYRKVVVDAAASLASRYSSIVGCTRSWGSASSKNFTVIVDNMMNLELLFYAAAHGGNAAWRNMAISHALKTREQFIRPDGSTWHVVEFDPATGEVRSKHTHQGLSDDSTWARGQAWAIYGFTMAFRETKDTRFLDAARRTADWYIAHLPSDKVPYWDFSAAVAGQPRDSAAAAVAASGLTELARIDTSSSRRTKYRDAAGGMLSSLSSSSYLARGTSSRSILLHGTGNKPAGDFNRGYSYGDYYFVEALLRWRKLTAPAT